MLVPLRPLRSCGRSDSIMKLIWTIHERDWASIDSQNWHDRSDRCTQAVRCKWCIYPHVSVETDTYWWQASFWWTPSLTRRRAGTWSTWNANLLLRRNVLPSAVSNNPRSLVLAHMEHLFTAFFSQATPKPFSTTHLPDQWIFYSPNAYAYY